MSLQSEISKTKEYLRQSRNAVLDRGGEISQTAGLKDLPSAIRSISADTSVAFQTDDSIAYVKTVPENAENRALLQSVGGMTYRVDDELKKSKVTAIVSKDASGNEIARYAIPEDIQMLDGYGEGVAARQNTIDFSSKIFILNCKKVVFTGDEDWKYADGTEKFYYCIKSIDILLGVGKIHQINSHFEHSSPFGALILSGGACRFYTASQFPTLDEWVAYVKSQYENGTPVTSVIAVANPITVDISAYLSDFDNIITVEGGGSLEFVNEYGNAVPSTITYVVKVGT